MKGCLCATCEGSRAYDQTRIEQRREFDRQRYAALDEAAIAQRRSRDRSRRRRLADERAAQRLEDFTRRTVL